jgi:hypothetical protein
MRPNISWSRPSHPGSQSYGCDDVTHTATSLRSGYNAELFQNVIVHERPVEKGRHPSVAHHGSLDLVQCSLSFPPAAVVRQTLIRHCYDERRSCFRSAPSLSVAAVTTPQFMPGILRWGEFREQFNESSDAGNCAGYPPPPTRCRSAGAFRKGGRTPRTSVGRFTVGAFFSSRSMNSRT